MNLIFESVQKQESDLGMNDFVIGATSEMRYDHRIIIFMGLSHKPGLKAMLIEVFPVLGGNEIYNLCRCSYCTYFLKSLTLVCTTTC